MYQVEIDRSLNRLHLTLARCFDKEQAEFLLEELEIRIGGLREGFEILTDLRNLKFVEDAARPFIKRSMDLCNRSGVGKIVRVVNNPLRDFGLKIMSIFHYKRNIPVITCSSLDEAQESLSSGYSST